MGFGLPSAIGAWFAHPEREVWTIVGDGGFQMTQAELSTAVQEGANVKIAIMNNNFLGMVRQWQEFFFEKRYSAVEMRTPDFIKIAEAHGIPARYVSEPDEVLPAIEFAQQTPGPVLIEFKVEKEEAVYPMVPAGADLDEMIRRPLRQALASGLTVHEEAEMQHTLIALVENKPGVLNRVASLFRRRNFNIESLNVGQTENPDISRMTIVMDNEDGRCAQSGGQPVQAGQCDRCAGCHQPAHRRPRPGLDQSQSHPRSTGQRLPTWLPSSGPRLSMSPPTR